MEKKDYKKIYKEFYNPSSKKPVVVDVPELNYLMIDGVGNPNVSQEYKDALATLYPVSYTIKFSLKKANVADFTVMPLEGLWWVEGEKEFSLDKKEDWSWTSMIMQPDSVSSKIVEDALVQVKEKRNPPALLKIRLKPYLEGLAVQIMHFGPYSEETPTIERLHAFAEEEGYNLRGKHHEIYLSDPNRTTPHKMKTVIRQPVK